MKTKLLLIPCFLLCSFNFTSCAVKEDGDINEWVDTYIWGDNREEHWYRPVFGDDTKRSKDTKFPMPSVNLEIKEDKTWILPDPKGPGKTGRIRCYKDHINLLDMNLDYSIRDNFNFVKKVDTTTGRKMIMYKNDGSSGRSGVDFNYDVRIAYLWNNLN